MKTSVREDGNHVLYLSEDEDELYVKFTDDIVDGRGNVKETLNNKGTINAAITAHIFKVLASYHVPTYFKSQKSAKELLLKKTELLPVKVSVEFEKDEAGQDKPMLQYNLISERTEQIVETDELLAEEIVTEEQLAEIRRYTLKVNVVLGNFFERRGLELLGFFIQFGLVNGKLAVCSDFTLDTCDLKDAGSRTKFTSSYLTSHLESGEELYDQVHNMIMF